MSTARIGMITGQHPSANPRLLKVADHLAAKGYSVDVWHPELDPGRTPEDQQLEKSGGWRRHTYFRWSAGRVARFRGRMARRLAAAAVRRNRDTPIALGYGVATLAAKLPTFDCYDLVIGHQEIGLWAVSRCPTGPKSWVDLEDWYSEDLPAASRDGRPIGLLRELESWALNAADFCTTTSHPMAEGLVERYGGESPMVIPNVFRWCDRENRDGASHDRSRDDPYSFHWFSQTIGPSRGLETLLQAAARVQQPCEIHLRGNINDKGWMTSQIPAAIRRRVKIHDCVPNRELLSRISEHGAGLALEIPYCENKLRTTSNKLYGYLAAGLPVIATDTLGHRDVLERCPELGVLVRPENVEDMEEALVSFIDRPCLSETQLDSVRMNHCWEAIVPRVDQAISNLLNSRRP